MRKYIIKGIACCAVLWLTACSTPQDFNYLQDLKDGDEIAMRQDGHIRLKPGDKISILVKSKVPEMTVLFNNPLTVNIESGTMVGSQYMAGYTIDSDGNIDFPQIGQVKVEGLTREQVAKLVKEKLATDGMLNDATITVEYMNLTYTVLGEVARPGKQQITKDVTTLLDALSNAGDISVYGKRDSVVVVRDEGDKKKTYMVSMNSAKSLYGSEAYYIHQNDLIYVKSNNVRARQSTANGNESRNISVWLSVISVLTTVAVFLFK